MIIWSPVIGLAVLPANGWSGYVSLEWKSRRGARKARQPTSKTMFGWWRPTS
jgi:hypothetical protein